MSEKSDVSVGVFAFEWNLKGTYITAGRRKNQGTKKVQGTSTAHVKGRSWPRTCINHTLGK